MSWGRTRLTAELQSRNGRYQHICPAFRADRSREATEWSRGWRKPGSFHTPTGIWVRWAVQAYADFCSIKPCCHQQAKESEKTDKEHDNCTYLQGVTVSCRGRARDWEPIEASLNDARLGIERYEVNQLRTGGIGQRTVRVLSPVCRPALLGALEREVLPAELKGRSCTVPNPPKADEGLVQKTVGLDSWGGGQGRAALLCPAAALAFLLLIE